ncbi:DUF6653 family protein [Primorskyibacter sp. 2E107]|uniref:DUF6653 family protein n=1 Tax=Primorskyibacter sp. 2E107 TaxID=3403458 RepID=UPI003AF99D22
MSGKSAFARTESLLRMSDATWQRHTNPWSGWSRLSILPLLALAAWSRIWLGWYALVPLTLVLLWTWLNPRLFAMPQNTDNWMSQGVLGERTWIAQSGNPALAHHRPVIHTLTALTGAGALVLMLGLIFLSPALTLAGLAVAMLGKLWLLDRMVWIRKDTAE